MEPPYNLNVTDVGKIAGCHRNTVLNYEKKGIIKSKRTIYKHRRYSLNEAIKLQYLLNKRIDNDNPQNHNND